jgi:AcrR family transcriptional regulator
MPRVASETKRREERRGEIVAAAQRIIVRSGPAKCTTREVAAESGLNKGLVYYYFPTGRAIVDAAMADFADQLKAAIRAGGNDLIERYLAVFTAQPGLAQAWFEYLMAAERENHLEPVATTMSAVITDLTAALSAETDADVDVRARILLSYMLGVLIRGIADPTALDQLGPEIDALTRAG